MSPRARTAQERREASQARRTRRAQVDDPDVVMEAAAAFLAVRQRSVEETRRRLNQLGYRAALCDEVVARLVELGYLDDVAFATAWVESRDRARPRGVLALRRELQLKGVPEHTIREVLEARSEAVAERAADDHAGLAADADREAAMRLVERRASTLRRETDPRRRRQKAYALLARHGFAPDVCHEVASRSIGDGDDEAIEGV